MHHRLSLTALPLLLALAPACADPVTPVDWCEGPISYDYDPDPSLSFTTFPDDHWTVEDPSTPTGLRVSMSIADNPVMATFPENYSGWFDQLSTLDGFGVSAELFFDFDGKLDPGTLSDDDLFLLALPEGGEPQRIAMSWRLADRDRVLMVQPLTPLPAATQATLILRTDPSAADCISPSPTLRGLLAPESELGEDESPHALSPRFQAAVDAAGLERAEVAAMTVFTTQSSTATSVAVAQDIAATGNAFTDTFSCSAWDEDRYCTGLLEVTDYRDSDGVVLSTAPSPQASYDLPVSVWLPSEEVDGPYPVIMCGHGLGGSTADCEGVVEFVLSEGVALVAVDAVEHGAHPSISEPPMELLAPLNIFAIQLEPYPTVDGLRLRDNFRQSAWDKLQVLEALSLGVDVDGDGEVDLDGERIAYAGVSLGAIMGAEPLALSEHLLGGWLANGGARVTQIIQDSASFSILIDLMAAGIDEGDVDRGFAMLQTLVDAGDPVSFAPHVTRDRLLDDGWEPSLVAVFAHEDDVVPNSTHENYMRALGLPGVGREVWEVEGVEFSDGDLVANLPQGGAGGVVLFDEVTRNGERIDATHGNLHRSDEPLSTLEGMVRPLAFGGDPVVVDPHSD